MRATNIYEISLYLFKNNCLIVIVSKFPSLLQSQMLPKVCLRLDPYLKKLLKTFVLFFGKIAWC